MLEVQDAYRVPSGPAVVPENARIQERGPETRRRDTVAPRVHESTPDRLGRIPGMGLGAQQAAYFRNTDTRLGVRRLRPCRMRRKRAAVLRPGGRQAAGG